MTTPLKYWSESRTLFTLSNATNICKASTTPVKEFEGNVEYAQARSKVLSMIEEGQHSSLDKWEKRVKPTLQLCSRSFIDKELTDDIPDGLTKYGRVSTVVITNCYSNWYKYRRSIQDYKERVKNASQEEAANVLANVKKEI
tara:strand:- start:317 stop:742 length:426 start_codon:yes stop_codon:yes gene_type:complete